MNFFITAAVLLAIIGLLMAVAFSETLRIQIINALLGITVTNTPSLSPEPAETESNFPPAAPIAPSSTKAVPSGFIGPTTKPHIIGPSGNPPNY